MAEARKKKNGHTHTQKKEAPWRLQLTREFCLHGESEGEESGSGMLWESLVECAHGWGARMRAGRGSVFGCEKREVEETREP